MEPKATTFLQREFMTMLHRNGMLEYAIVPPSTENESLCLQGENSFQQAELMDPEVAALCTTFMNSWRKSEHQIVLVSTFSHYHLITLPLQWEGSVIKLLAEFTSLTNLVYDIPPMGASAALSEILRRCEHLLNVEPKTSKREYSTPYCGFFHTHMTSFNQVVVNAIATPSGVDIRMLMKEGLLPETWEYQLQKSVENSPMVALQWPFRLEHLRLIDSENQMFAGQLTDIVASNAKCKAPHVNLARDGLFYYQDYEVPAKAVSEMIRQQFGGFRRRNHHPNLHKTIPAPTTDYEVVDQDKKVKLTELR